MPWRDEQCRSAMAGLSGILYAMAALACPSPWEKALWCLQVPRWRASQENMKSPYYPSGLCFLPHAQAALSVWADYFQIHHDHVAHGIDRCLATFNTFRMILLGLHRLQPLVALLGVIPLTCCFRAAGAKADNDLDGWMFWHGAWHVTGAALITCIMAAAHGCEAGVSSAPFPFVCLAGA